MGRKAKMHDVTIKYKGLFDQKRLLMKMMQWLKEQEFLVFEGTCKYKIPSPRGREEELLWKGERKVNAYCMYWVDVYFHFFNVKEVSVINNNQEETKDHGKLLIYIIGSVELDWQNKYSGNKFLDSLGSFFNQLILREESESVWIDRLDYRLYKFERVIKDELKMEGRTNAYEGVW